MLTHLQAIDVKYYGATNTKGARWKATTGAGSITVPYDYTLSPGENAEKAAESLQKKLGWNYDLIGGEIRKAYVFVMVPKKKVK